MNLKKRKRKEKENQALIISNIGIRYIFVLLSSSMTYLIFFKSLHHQHIILPEFLQYLSSAGCPTKKANLCTRTMCLKICVRRRTLVSYSTFV